VIGLVQVGAQAMADRYTYVPLSGLFVAACWGLPELLRGFRYRREALAGVAAAALLVLSVLSFRQVGYWKSTETLFRRALEVTESNWLAHSYLGAELASQGKMDEAVSHLGKSIRINPRYPDSLFNLGLAFQRKGMATEARSYYLAALSLEPDYFPARLNLGTLLVDEERYREAVPHLRHALRLRPGDPGILFRLDRALSPGEGGTPPSARIPPAETAR